jgi:hypothetical protein
MKINKYHHKGCNQELDLNKKPLELKHYSSLKKCGWRHAPCEGWEDFGLHGNNGSNVSKAEVQLALYYKWFATMIKGSPIQHKKKEKSLFIDKPNSKMWLCLTWMYHERCWLTHFITTHKLQQVVFKGIQYEKVQRPKNMTNCWNWMSSPHQNLRSKPPNFLTHHPMLTNVQSRQRKKCLIVKTYIVRMPHGVKVMIFLKSYQKGNQFLEGRR